MLSYLSIELARDDRRTLDRENPLMIDMFQVLMTFCITRSSKYDRKEETNYYSIDLWIDFYHSNNFQVMDTFMEGKGEKYLSYEVQTGAKDDRPSRNERTCAYDDPRSK